MPSWQMARMPPLSFLLKLCVIVLHTHRYHPPKFHPNLKHHDGFLIFPHFACAACLLAACLLACCLIACLLAAKPGRSTLDTKKGYETKTGSTSSVTRALTLTPPPSPLAGCPHDPRLDPPPDPLPDPPPPPGPPARPPPTPREEPPSPPAAPPPPQVLKDSWGVGRIRTGCSRPPRVSNIPRFRQLGYCFWWSMKRKNGRNPHCVLHSLPQCPIGQS